MWQLTQLILLLQVFFNCGQIVEEFLEDGDGIYTLLDVNNDVGVLFTKLPYKVNKRDEQIWVLDLNDEIELKVLRSPNAAEIKVFNNLMAPAIKRGNEKKDTTSNHKVSNIDHLKNESKDERHGDTKGDLTSNHKINNTHRLNNKSKDVIRRTTKEDITSNRKINNKEHLKNKSKHETHSNTENDTTSNHKINNTDRLENKSKDGETHGNMKEDITSNHEVNNTERLKNKFMSETHGNTMEDTTLNHKINNTHRLKNKSKYETHPHKKEGITVNHKINSTERLRYKSKGNIRLAIPKFSKTQNDAIYSKQYLKRMINKVLFSTEITDPEEYSSNKKNNLSLKLFFKRPYCSIVLVTGRIKCQYFTDIDSEVLPRWFYEEHKYVKQDEKGDFVEIPENVKNEFYQKLFNLLEILFANLSM